MSADVPDVEMLFSPPRNQQSDVEMIPEVASEQSSREPSAGATSEELSRLTSLSLTEKGKLPSVYVEVPTLPAEAKARYATDLKERSITSDEEFPEENMDCIVGEYEIKGELHYFVKMSSGMAFKVNSAASCHSLLIQFQSYSFQRINLPRSILVWSKNMVRLSPYGTTLALIIL